MAWDRERDRRAGKALGVGGCIYGIVFLVVWCAIAIGMGAWFMLIFGIPMLGFMIFRLVVLLRMGKKPPQEPREKPPVSATAAADRTDICSYCGNQLEEGFAFCPKCGRRQGL